MSARAIHANKTKNKKIESSVHRLKENFQIQFTEPLAAKFY